MHQKLKERLRDVMITGLSVLVLGTSSCAPKNKHEENLVHKVGVPVSVKSSHTIVRVILDNLEDQNYPIEAYTSASSKDIVHTSSLLDYAKEKGLEVELVGASEGYNQNMEIFTFESFDVKYPKNNPFYKNPLASFTKTN